MHQKHITSLKKKHEHLCEGGGPERMAKQHDANKLSARERIALLVKPGTFHEMGLYMEHRSTEFGMDKKDLPGDAVVTGCGKVKDRHIYIASQDFTVAGGSMGEVSAKKICEIMDLAMKTRSPFVFINDGGGARIQEGVDSLNGYGDIFYRNVLLSGVVPQISIVAGPCAGGAAYSPALTDLIIQVKSIGQMYITGPKIIKEVTGEEITAEALGGVESHATYSGVVHLIADDEAHAIKLTKRLLSFLPNNNTEKPPFAPKLHKKKIKADPKLNSILPDNPRRAYNMLDIVKRIVDQGDFLELQHDFAGNLLIGFARLNGNAVGIVANQPLVRAGVLDIDSSDKAARFIRFCNAFNIPLVNFVDVPGFMPGVQQEYGGIIRHGAKVLFAYASATVPKLTVVIRKAYGGAYLAMCAKSMGADRVCAWPTAEIAVMGAEGAVNILYRKELAEAADPKAEKAKLAAHYRDTFANPYVSASRGLVHDVIEPATTRNYLCSALEQLLAKQELRPVKKHGLIPL